MGFFDKNLTDRYFWPTFQIITSNLIAIIQYTVLIIVNLLICWMVYLHCPDSRLPPPKTYRVLDVETTRLVWICRNFWLTASKFNITPLKLCHPKKERILLEPSHPIWSHRAGSDLIEGRQRALVETVGHLQGSLNGCFQKSGYPKMDGLWWKTLIKWMIWGYHYFRKHPNCQVFFWGEDQTSFKCTRNFEGLTQTIVVLFGVFSVQVFVS